MDSCFYSLEDDDLFALGDTEPGHYTDSLEGSPYSPSSDIDNHIIYDPQSDSLQSAIYDFPLPHPHHHHPNQYYHHTDNDANSLSPHHPQEQHIGGTKRPIIRKVVQRKAANTRERRRMKCINDAFETLRSCIPEEVQCSERRLSKVDTLRQAVRYISYLSDLLQSSCSDYDSRCHSLLSPGAGGGGAVGRVGHLHRLQNKVIVRSQCADSYSGQYADHQIHSLSWEDSRRRHLPCNSKLVAKVWVPENPTDSDLINLATHYADY